MWILNRNLKLLKLKVVLKQSDLWQEELIRKTNVSVYSWSHQKAPLFVCVEVESDVSLVYSGSVFVIM